MLPPDNLDEIFLEYTQEEGEWRDRQDRQNQRNRQLFVASPAGYDRATGRDLYNGGKIAADSIAAGGTNLTQLTAGFGSPITIVDAPPYFANS